MSGPARRLADPGRRRAKSSSTPGRQLVPRGRRPSDPRSELGSVPLDFGRLAVEACGDRQIQPKLVVGGHDDHWEREADANAEAVVRALDGRSRPGGLSFTPVTTPPASGSGGAPLQRQVEENEEEEELLQAKRATARAPDPATATEAEIRALRGGGRRLPDGLRVELESRFGVDLGGVRVHTGPTADDLAGRIGARAFTVGRDVVFAGGEYRPGSRDGRRLLAHELTHVVQQARSGGGGDGRVQRKSAAAPPAPRRALDAALKGDDDDVRDLTASKVWPGLDVQAGESATLVEHLLDGATLDADEQAGLKVLFKAWMVSRIDDTLEVLGDRGRFKQLLDDYHGAEYRELLSLLSHAIGKRRVKALYLDSFIAMWWLNTAEEEAVVVLLERSSDSDVAALLEERNRLGELRSDIDDAGLAARFELQVGQGQHADFDTIRKQLEAIFRVRAMFAVGSRTMSGARLKQRDVDRLLKGAARDLAVELRHYQAELVAAIPSGDLGRVRKINDRFRARLQRLLAEKSYEFKLELKWNKEFNRALDRAFARSWTGIDVDKRRGELGEIDRMLRMIPPQLLYANRSLSEFRRGTTDPESPDVVGRASATHITLFKGLDPGVTAHEVGHFIHRDAPKIYEEFKKKSGWELRTEAQIRREGLRQELVDTLDRQRSDKSTYGSVSHGKFTYHWARYGGAKTYWRYRSDADFVSRYARTDPQDDFAETFEAYIVRYEKDRGKAPEKFRFMHDEIFVKYWLRKEKERILDEFMDVGSGLEDTIKDRWLRVLVWKRGGLRVKRALDRRLDGLATKRYDDVIKEKPRKRVPLKRWPEAWEIGNGFIDILKTVYRFGAELDSRFKAFKGDARSKMKAYGGDLAVVHGEIVDSLEKAVARRMGGLLEKPCRLLLAGKEISPKPWPELEVEIRQGSAALSVTGGYAPYLQRHKKARQDLKFSHESKRPIDLVRSLDPWDDFDPLAKKLLGSFPVDSVNHTILVAGIKRERDDTDKEFDRQKMKMLELIRQGKRYRRGLLVEPSVLVGRYRRNIRRRFNQVTHRKRTNKPKGKRPQWF